MVRWLGSPIESEEALARFGMRLRWGLADGFFLDCLNLNARSATAHRHALSAALFPYVERFYNRERLHSTLDYRTHDQVEKDFPDSNNFAKVA